MTAPAAPAAELLIGALCAYRITRLMTTDSITAPLRHRLTAPPPPGAHPLRARAADALAGLLSCDHCSSVHAAAITAVLPRRARAVLAVAGAVSVYRELVPPGG